VFNKGVELIETQTATTEPTLTHSKNDQHDKVTKSIEQNLEDNNSLIDRDNNCKMSEQEGKMSVKGNASPSQHHVFDTSNDTIKEEIDDNNTEKNELFIQPHQTGHQRSAPLRYGLVIKVLAISAVVEAFFTVTENAVTEGELKTYKEAIDTVNSLQWKKTMKKEVQLLKSNQTWTLMNPSADWKILEGKWVFRVKQELKKNVLRYKTHWVVKGYEQHYNIDYEQTFAAVVKSMIYKVLFVITAHYDLKLEQMNIKTAFLNRKLEKIVFVKQPTDYKKGDKVCQLNKALYELKQSSQVWYKMIYNFLLKNHFCWINTDHSVFVKNSKMIVTVYVNDLLILECQTKWIDSLKQRLTTRFEMTDLKLCTHYLEMQVTWDKKAQTLHMSQETYLHKVLISFKLQNSCSVITSMKSDNYL